MAKGRIEFELLFMLITVVVTSAAILYLVQSGMITVKAENSDVSVLNTEFIPVVREGTLVVKEFQFCESVDCSESKETFALGEEVHFTFVVETSVYNGEIILIENYRVKGPDGTILLQAEAQDNRQVENMSSERLIQIHFAEFIRTEERDQSGDYQLELLVENPLLAKKVAVTKMFRLEP